MTNMKDSNWNPDRQSILNKYDKNGDGIYDTNEVNAIVDDYMTTIRNNNALIDTNKGQKKLLILCGLMIFILSLSNLGTAFLAANLAKDTRVAQDGIMTATDGTAIKTMNTAESITITGKASFDSNSSDTLERKLLGFSDERSFACVTEDEMMKLFNNAIGGSGTSLTLQDEEMPSVQKTIFIAGRVSRRSMNENDFKRRLSEGRGTADYVTDFEYAFPEANISFEYAPDECAGRRKLTSVAGRFTQPPLFVAKCCWWDYWFGGPLGNMNGNMNFP